MKSRDLLIRVILLCVLAAWAFPLPAPAAIDADAACQKAGAIARALDLPWGEQVEVVRESAAGRYGDRDHWVVKYFNFAEITLNALDGAVVSAINLSAFAELVAEPTVVNTTEQVALARATDIARTIGVFSEPVRLRDVRLHPDGEGQDSQWHVRWVRTADGIPYRGDGAIVMLEPTTGKLLGTGTSFWSRPPESTKVHIEESAGLLGARQHARALGITEADVPPTVELQVVQPNNYWKRTRDYGSQIAIPYPGYSRVAWAVTIKEPSTLGQEGAVSQKLFWIDALDGKLLGGAQSIGVLSSAPAAAKTVPTSP